VKFEIINPSDPYTMEAEDLEIAAVAVSFLGAGRYALQGIGKDAGTDVPIFLFGGHDEWFAEKFGMDFDATSTHVLDHRAEALATALDSVTLGRAERSSLNNIKATAQALSNAVRKRAPAIGDAP
jgi:hypothetical protein